MQDENMINLQDAQSHFNWNWTNICKKPIRELWFLRTPTQNGEIVLTHHILDKRMKMVFGKWRMSQPDPNGSYTTTKLTKEALNKPEHMEYVNGFKKIMGTKTCPYCGKTIDAIEMKLNHSRVDSIRLLHFHHTPDTHNGYSYHACPLNEKEFYDLQLNPQ
jgi:hypothetical protein